MREMRYNFDLECTAHITVYSENSATVLICTYAVSDYISLSLMSAVIQNQNLASIKESLKQLVMGLRPCC